MIKTLSIQPTATVADIEKMVKEEGIKENRLSGAFGASFLPKSGKFESFGVDGDTGLDENGQPKMVEGKPVPNTRHIRIGTANMLDSISLSRLQINLHVGGNIENEDAMRERLVLSSKQKYFLPGNHIVNPGLQGNQALVVKKMLGKWFVASEISGIGTNYVEGGFTSTDQVQFRPVKAYKVELFNTEAEQKAYLKSLETKEVE